MVDGTGEVGREIERVVSGGGLFHVLPGLGGRASRSIDWHMVL
jgi:hypothetical protein